LCAIRLDLNTGIYVVVARECEKTLYPAVFDVVSASDSLSCLNLHGIALCCLLLAQFKVLPTTSTLSDTLSRTEP
jgi:hypothetical protein